MIFVTIGSAVKGIEFTRLIKEMDEIAGKIDEEVVMQIGTVPYEPQNSKYFRYTSYQENLSYFQKASLVIGHGGTGTILNALRFQVPIVVVPRRHHYGEHVDDHQVELAQRLVGNELIKVVYELEDLESAVKEMQERSKKVDKGKMYAERDTLIKTLKDFVERCP
jgi:UDP-N-acetylglucosamine transferase subunit ALG13